MGIVLIAVLAGTLCAAGDVSAEVDDAATTARIETLFLLNQHLSPFNINTTTKDGHVTLTGSVNDDVQRELAEELATSAKGVKSVENRITAVPTVVGEKERRTFRQKWDDRTLSATIRSRLLYHRQFKGLRVGVSAVNGVVTLHGTVNTVEQRKTIASVTEDTKGVERVINNLTVSPKKEMDPVANIGRQFSDEWVESRVETAILLNKHLSVRELDVEVDDGVCILSGTVNSEVKRSVAADVAASIQGVDKVRNDIRVAEASTQPPLSAEPTKPAQPVQLESAEGLTDDGAE